MPRTVGKVSQDTGLDSAQYTDLRQELREYALDPAHPERQKCLGSREAGDFSEAKVKMGNCVVQFLTVGGYGDKYWGKTTANRNLKWPEDDKRIIAAVSTVMSQVLKNHRDTLVKKGKRSQARRAHVGNPMSGPYLPSSPVSGYSSPLPAFTHPQVPLYAHMTAYSTYPAVSGNERHSAYTEQEMTASVPTYLTHPASNYNEQYPSYLEQEMTASFPTPMYATSPTVGGGNTSAYPPDDQSIEDFLERLNKSNELKGTYQDSAFYSL